MMVNNILDEVMEKAENFSMRRLKTQLSILQKVISNTVKFNLSMKKLTNMY